MQRPTQDAPCGFLHAWYSSSAYEHGTSYYKDENGKDVCVTEVTTEFEPASRQTDLQYVGIVVGGTWREGTRSKLSDLRYNQI